MAFRYSVIFYLLLTKAFLFPFLLELVGAEDKQEEEFSEELLLRPLPDRKVLAHFHFESSVPSTETYGQHHILFPKAIYQLVQKFRIREMELSFTQGRWNYDRWGGFDPMSSSNAKPPGVELWAVFDVPLNVVDATWKNLSHALSGLFCASINFLESSASFSAPGWGFRSHSGYLRYGALPREAVCTENLTPWLKLLPCRDKAGLAAIMDRPSIYKGYYHSQRLKITSATIGITLEQTLTVVLQPSIQRPSAYSSGSSFFQPNWSISSLFGRKIIGKCVLAKTSLVFLELEGNLISKLEDRGKENTALEVSITPTRMFQEANKLQVPTSSIMYQFSVEEYSDDRPLDMGISWKLPIEWTCSQAPFLTSRFLMGSGNERGSIAISLKSLGQKEMLSDLRLTSSTDECKVRVVVFQIVPWYVKAYYHTLQVFVDGRSQAFSDLVKKIQVSPSEDKVSPGVMEMELELPCDVRSAAITLEFDKGFLHIDEYPPDANQGFDLPSAVISFPDLQASVHYAEGNSSRSPLISKFQARNIVQSYTEVLLVPLTTPDFSMPYNVITFTCTVLALYFGSLLNALRRRVGEEERYSSKVGIKRGLIPQVLSRFSARLRGKKTGEEPSSSQSSPSSATFGNKLLFKVVLVALFAVVLHYLNDH
ncbi:hypothetical protein H6P81_007414 [Aristolochia fimbriata]|uniref:GPI transamidase component PIG-T n=1 Tax=Aristolochia fimbriata TaxID=158543 RepID=A0AAV7F2D1_ARIFI|nr:hypothetical protein H6P81_007414 [Aristolochia fimbriata]